MKKDGVDLDNEYLILSYFIRNPEKFTNQKAKLFLNQITSSIADAVLKLKEKRLEISLDTIYNIASKQKDFNFEILQNIYDGFIDYSNIEYHIEVLESDFVKHTVIKNTLKELITKAHNPDILTTQEILTATENIRRAVVSTLDSSSLRDSKDLVETYRQTIEDRISGKNKSRSIGFRVLDNKLTKPAAPKELTIIAALRGSGKTAFKQAIHNNLVLKKVPVLEFSLEMSEESNMDRTISMKASVNTFDLNKNIDSDLLKKVNRVLEDFEKYDNFLTTDDSNISFDVLDSMLYKAKDIFYRRGLLGDDEYLLYTVDLLEMVTDFGEKSPREISMAMDTWFRKNKTHNCHGVGIVQINENKLRSMNFQELDDVDKYRPNLEDIYGGSAYAQRARTVMLLNRPRFMKERYFPELEEEWSIEPDIIKCHIVKQNDGSLFVQDFVFDPTIMRIVPFSIEE